MEGDDGGGGGGAGRRGSRDKNVKGMNTTSCAIRVTCTPLPGSTSKKSDSRGLSPISPTQGDTVLRMRDVGIEKPKGLVTETQE